MAYVRFRALLNDGDYHGLEAEWFTAKDAELEHWFEEDQEYRASYGVYEIELTDEQVAKRNDAARTYFDWVVKDHEFVGEPVIE